MKLTKEIRDRYKKLIKKYGKKNGRVKGALFDIPEIDRKIAQNDKRKQRKKFKNS